MTDRRQTWLRQLPKMDELMAAVENRGSAAQASREKVKTLCREAVEALRYRILSLAEGDVWEPPALETVAARVEERLDALHHPRLRRVINATGVILHTNLGRAPLPEAVIRRVADVARGYCNLEYDLDRGERGHRYSHVEPLLCLLTGAEAALAVNNNAAAVLLAVNTLAEGREVIVSRGELVEIGGEFRIPDVIAKSGARLREVGTTNRTRLKDYERAVTPDAALLLKVHPSNFRIVGFTEEAALADLVALGHRHGLIVMDDLGSGCLLDLAPYGLPGEPVVPAVMKTGVDLVTFSGDKLLGGPQAGILAGRRDLIEAVRRNPLHRALRIDKLTLAALEATLSLYLSPADALASSRILSALTEPLGEVEKRARRLLGMLKRTSPEGLSFALRRDASMAGGGAFPEHAVPTVLVAVRSAHLSPSRLAERLRALSVPVIARVAEDELLLDVRTLTPEECREVRDALARCTADAG